MISLNNYMPLVNRKRKKNIKFNYFEQIHTLNKDISAENEIRKNKNSEDFLLNPKQVFSRLCLQIEPVPAKPTHSS